MKSLELYHGFVSSDLKNACQVIRTILSQFENYDVCIAEDAIFDLKVILNELVVNAIKHGNQLDNQKSVEIRTGISDSGKAYVIVADQGRGHDCSCHMNHQSTMSDRTADYICEMKESGRGIWLVKNLCDSIRFNKAGNKVVVLKNLTKGSL